LSHIIHNLTLLVLFMPILLLPTAVPAQLGPHVISIRVAGEVTARGERLQLADVATFSGADSRERERLEKISLGFAPNVGAVRELTRERIALAVAAAGFSGEAVEIQAPQVVLVRRAAQAVEPSLIREAVEQAILKELRAKGAAVRLARLDLPALLEVPSGEVEARAFAAGVRDLFKPFSVSIEILVDGRVVRRLNLPASIEAFAPVLVAARDIPAGSRLRETDVRVEAIRLTRPLSTYLFNITSLRGVAAQSPIATGEPILTSLLSSEIVIRPGDQVRIVGESDSISINVLGTSRGAGRVGDRIQVRNSQSGSTFQAIVVDEGLVRVRF
jgi:flagella basal body P-ring formation protein FlgA